MNGSAPHSLSTERGNPNDIITKMQIALSPEVYARALLICQLRDCTLEAVVEDLIERFLPPARVEKKLATTTPVPGAAQPGEAKSRWIPSARGSKKRLG